MRETSLDEFTGGDEYDGSDDSTGEPVDDSTGEPADDSTEKSIDETTVESIDGDTSAEPADGSLGETTDGAPGQADDVDDESVGRPVPTGDTDCGVDPAVSTYDWTPVGAECDGCAATVGRRWHDDGRRVCVDCKDW